MFGIHMIHMIHPLKLTIYMLPVKTIYKPNNLQSILMTNNAYACLLPTLHQGWSKSTMHR